MRSEGIRRAKAFFHADVKKPIKLLWRSIKNILSAWLRSGSYIISMHWLVRNTSGEPRRNVLSVNPPFRCRSTNWKELSVSN